MTLYKNFDCFKSKTWNKIKEIADINGKGRNEVKL